MSSHSKYILDKKLAKDYWDESNWNTTDFEKTARLTDRSKNDYLAEKEHLEKVICSFNPKISKNSKILTQNYHNVS